MSETTKKKSSVGSSSPFEVPPPLDDAQEKANAPLEFDKLLVSVEHFLALHSALTSEEGSLVKKKVAQVELLEKAPPVTCARVAQPPRRRAERPTTAPQPPARGPLGGAQWELWATGRMREVESRESAAGERGAGQRTRAARADASMASLFNSLSSLRPRTVGSSSSWHGRQLHHRGGARVKVVHN